MNADEDTQDSHAHVRRVPRNEGKRALLRIVKNAEGAISFDRVGKAPGRGAYVCKSEECLTKAVRQHQLERALETKIDEAVYQQLMEEIHAD